MKLHLTPSLEDPWWGGGGILRFISDNEVRRPVLGLKISDLGDLEIFILGRKMLGGLFWVS